MATLATDQFYIRNSNWNAGTVTNLLFKSGNFLVLKHTTPLIFVEFILNSTLRLETYISPEF